MPKISTLVDHLLPTPESTIASLLSLSLQEFERMCETPSPKEKRVPKARVASTTSKPSKPSTLVRKPEPTEQDKQLAQARGWLSTYHKKLQVLIAKAEATPEQDSAKGVVAKATAGVAQKGGLRRGGRALSALNGTDPTANETGFVQRIVKGGSSAWDAIEKLEKANVE